MAEIKFLKLLRSIKSGFTPPKNDLGVSQLAVNFADKMLFTKGKDGRVIPLTARAITVDHLITGTTVVYQNTTAAKYLIQRTNLAALANVTNAVRDAMTRTSVHQKEVQTITITGAAATGAGTYTPIPGTSIAYTNGETNTNMANLVATELDDLAGITATNTGNTVTVTFDDYKTHTLLAQQNRDGFNITVARTRAGGNANFQWAIIASDGTDWYVEEVADTIDFHTVYVRSDTSLRLIEDDVLHAIPYTFVSDSQIPTARNPTTTATTDKVLITPNQVREMFEGIRIYRDFEAIDAANVATITDSKHQVHKTFFAVSAGTVAIGATSYTLAIGDILYKANAGWTQHKAATGSGGPDTNLDKVSKTGHGFVTGDIVYFNKTNRQYEKAKADSYDTCGITALVKRVDANNFEALFSGVHGGFSGLTVGETYYLSQGTAGATQVALPSNGIIKFCFQALSATKALVLPIIAYGVSSGGAGSGGASYTRQELIDIITKNGGEGSSKFLAGDGSFKDVPKTEVLFDNVKKVGAESGQPAFDFPPTSADRKTCLISKSIDKTWLSFETLDVATNTGTIELGANTFARNRITAISNTSTIPLTVKSTSQFFKNPNYDGGKNSKESSFVLRPDTFAILFGNSGTSWMVLSSDSVLIDDTADDKVDNRTWSAKKIDSEIQNLINDSATSGDLSTWSVNRIKNALTASENKVDPAIRRYIDDSAYSTTKLWSSKKNSDENDKIQDHRLVETSLASTHTTLHIDAFYRSGVILKRPSEVNTDENMHNISGRDTWRSYLTYSDSKDGRISSRVSARPGYYALIFDGTKTFADVDRAGLTKPTGNDIFDTRETMIIAVIRPKRFPAGIQESDSANYDTIIHDGGQFVLGFNQDGICFSTQDGSSNKNVMGITIPTAQLDKDWIVMAYKDDDDDLNMHIIADGGYSITDSQPVSHTSVPSTTHHIEVGRGGNNKYFKGHIMELIVINGGSSVWADRSRYFDYFARKWGVTTS